MNLRPILLLLAISASHLSALEPPKLLDPALKLEALATYPEVEACTTVVGAPDGSFYVGCDPRDGRLNTDKPECFIVRFSSMGADKKRTVFAGKIFSPAGSAWHDRWLYVAHDPFLTRFRDTDGDGIADVREDLITNLGMQRGTGLNDHCASGFTLGMDGFFYMSIGDRGTFQTKSVKDGSTISLQGGGIIRFRPDGTQLEIFSTGTRNHLEVCLDAEDNAFTLDNTDDGNGWWTRLTHHIEGGYYGYPYDYQHAPNYGVTQPSKETLDAMTRNGHGGLIDTQATMNDGRKVFTAVVGARANPKPVDAENASPQSAIPNPHSFLPAMTDFGGGSPTGGLCYLSDGLPEQYRGKLLFSEWGKGGLFVIEVARDGATFRFVKNTPLIQGGNGSDFRPMQLSVAADGSLLIADWQWGGWKGPKTVGTIWRLSWPEAHPAPRLWDEKGRQQPKVSSTTYWDFPGVEELLAALAHPDRDQRLRAAGALAGMGESVRRMLSEIATGERFSTVARIHALWALSTPLQPGGLADISRGSSEATTPGTAPAKDSHPERVPDPNAANNASSVPAGAGSVDGGKPRVSPGANISQPSGLVAELLTAKDAAIRAQAARMLGATWAGANVGLDQPHKATVDRLEDLDAAVRLQTIIALGRTNGELTTSASMQYLLKDLDPWVRFAVVNALRKHEVWAENQTWPKGSALDGSVENFVEKVWWTLGGVYDARLVDVFASVATKPLPFDRTRAITALARIAYQPKPWDGHWWGTQPVKNPPPLPGVAWEGTEKAIETLTAALADADSGVRLAAAQAFANFLLDDSAKPAAATTLRARLTAETDPAIRRQLIESLGVQKDPQAMEVFRQIALGDPDMNFRETAIAAVVNIGGDDARKTIAQLASAQLSPAATRKIIQAAGELKVLEAAPALIAHLSDENAGDRESAIKSLAQLGPKSGALDALLPALADKDAKVQTAAVEAIGSFKDKRALPALLDFSKTKRARRETINAIAALTPDPQALPFLVDALREKGTGERRTALTALKKMRAEAWPMIEENLASGRIPAEFAPEIRAAFDSGVIAKWKLIGPFENVWEAVHPPEVDALAGGDFLKKKTLNAEGKETGWNDVSASADEGRVDLGKIFKTSGMVCAYVFTEIESPEDADAKLLCGSDDQIAVWLNGQKLHDSGPGSRGFNADQDEVPLHFGKGRNALLVKVGNVGGAWEFAVRIPGLDSGIFTPNKEPATDVKQRAYALVTKPDGSWQNPGDAKRGEKLFHDPTAALGGLCATCHAVRGKGGAVGPDLSAIAVNYRRPDLIVSILEPSKTIALGFEQNVIETKGGETFIGALRQESADAFTLVGADAQPHIVKKTDVKLRKPLELSLMPPGLTLALKPEDFSDLLAYLETLK